MSKLCYPWSKTQVIEYENHINNYLCPIQIGQVQFDAIMICEQLRDLQLVVDHYLEYHPFGIVFIEGDESIIPAGIQRVRVAHESELIGAGQRLYNTICI